MTADDSGDRVAVTFHPQEWVDSPGQSHDQERKRLAPAESREPTTFLVPAEDATHGDGTVYEDESYEATMLRDHPDAPDWVRNWDGACRITLDADGADAD